MHPVPPPRRAQSDVSPTGTGAGRAVGDSLVGLDAARQRVVDEQMFTVTCASGRRAATFRLQLFTASDSRPVAVATQCVGEGGSLREFAEEYAAEVWRRCFPADPAPPVWIELQLFSESSPSAGRERFTLVTFNDIGDPCELDGLQWHQLADADLERLVGGPVDRDRGTGYEPWPREPEERPSWHVTWTALLPLPIGVNRGCTKGQVPR